MKDIFKFERKLFKNGGSLAINLPVDVCRFLDLKEDTEVFIAVQEGKYGKYVAFWRKDQKKE